MTITHLRLVRLGKSKCKCENKGPYGDRTVDLHLLRSLSFLLRDLDWWMNVFCAVLIRLKEANFKRESEKIILHGRLAFITAQYWLTLLGVRYGKALTSVIEKLSEKLTAKLGEKLKNVEQRRTNFVNEEVRNAVQITCGKVDETYSTLVSEEKSTWVFEKPMKQQMKARDHHNPEVCFRVKMVRADPSKTKHGNFVPTTETKMKNRFWLTWSQKWRT